MRTYSAHRSAHFLAQKSTEANGITAKALFNIVFAALTTLFLLFPFSAHAEDMVPCSPELKSNRLQGLARIVKRIEPPSFKVISLLSGGRVKMVLPPKLIMNKLMDSVIVGTAPCSSELKSNRLQGLAGIVKRIEPPSFKVISLLSGGRVNLVSPPQLIMNKLMDGVIVSVGNK